MRSATATFLLAIALIVGSQATPRAVEASQEPFNQLRALMLQYPDDPDLLWTFISELEERHFDEEAVERLRVLISRWPERFPGAPETLARLLLRLGRHREALAELDALIELRPESPSCHLLRGLALRELGRPDESLRALQRAADLDPQLAPEALLVRALMRFDSGADQAAEALLEEILRMAPDSAVAWQARLLLEVPRGGSPASGRLDLSALAGVEFDSNVTLESSEDVGTAPTDESDLRALWGAGLRYRAVSAENGSLSVGYLYQQWEHRDIDTHDVQSHLLYTSAGYRITDDWMLRLDALALDSHLSGSRYLRSYSFRPAGLVTLGAGLGIARLHADFERIHYHDDPVLASLSRNACRYEAGVEHYLSVPGWEGAWVSIGGRIGRTNTRAGRDILGFDGAFDRGTLGADLRLRLPIVRDLDAELSARARWERYRNHNVIDALFSTDAPERRRDRVLQASLALSLPITTHTEVELHWRLTQQHSNVDAYRHHRHVIGIALRSEVTALN